MVQVKSRHNNVSLSSLDIAQENDNAHDPVSMAKANLNTALNLILKASKTHINLIWSFVGPEDQHHEE